MTVRAGNEDVEAREWALAVVAANPDNGDRAELLLRLVWWTMGVVADFGENTEGTAEEIGRFVARCQSGLSDIEAQMSALGSYAASLAAVVDRQQEALERIAIEGHQQQAISFRDAIRIAQAALDGVGLSASVSAVPLSGKQT